MTHTNGHSATEKTIFGFWLYLLSDVLLFATMFAAYAVLRNGTAGGITSSQLISLPLALGESLLLLLSCLTCGLCRGRFVIPGLLLTFLLGLLFFSAVCADLAHLANGGSSWDRSAFLSAYFLLVWTLLAHIASGLLWMIVLLIQILKRGLIDSTQRRLMCLQLFWPFLNIVWVGIFSWIYLIGAA